MTRLLRILLADSVILTDLCSQRVGEMGYRSESTAQTVTRIIHEAWRRRRSQATRATHARGIDAARQEYNVREGL